MFGACHRCTCTHKFATSVAFHGLSLTVSCIMVGTSALVTHCSTVGCDTVANTSIATTSWEAARARSAATHAGASGASTWGRTIAGNVPHLTAGITSTAGGTSTDAEGGTVSLNMAESLTMIALFRWACVRQHRRGMRWEGLTFGGARMRTLVGLVAGLLAVVAEALGRGAHFSVVADVAAFVAGATRER